MDKLWHVDPNYWRRAYGDLEQDLRIIKAESDKRMELLRRAHLQLIIYAPCQTQLIDELAKELGGKHGDG
jgi:hypothetical protein